MSNVRWLIRSSALVALMMVCGLFGGCAQSQGYWSARKLATLEGFKTPESAVADPATHYIYVSNIVAANRGEGSEPYWADDGVGFISQLDSPHKPLVREHFKSGPAARLSAPKGMCVLDRALWVADITNMVIFDLEGKKPPRTIIVPGSARLNDVTTDGKSVFVSDIQTGRIHQFGPDGSHRHFAGPPGVNGITFHRGVLYAASWTLHDLFIVDIQGKTPPVPLGLTLYFASLDGIEALPDGSLLASDFLAGQVLLISPDRRQVRTFITTPTPADIGLDRRTMILYVPIFKSDKVEVYQLNRS